MAMTARRQPSTTSLSKYVRDSSPIPEDQSLDFCNAFWGLGDAGVEVLFARMRGAARTMEELKNYWKERAAIEDDYSKRLAKLAKFTLGRDEVGDLRTSLDTVKSETGKQANYHATLAHQIRTELETPTSNFHSRQLHHKKTFQAAIEKEFKAKQTQESYVNKAREKYEADCVRINSYTAQSSLVQGKDLDKITMKLERAQQTVQVNERDFANFAKALQDTVHKWEQDWKAFCDSCQDMEDQRIEFMKDNMWAYANAVSTVCVNDDESCEKVRLSLEQMEPEREMENFVRDYGTGNQIPDPPAFVNYNTPDAIPSSSARPTTRTARFVRATHREAPQRQLSLPPLEPEPDTNAAGVGAGGGSRRDSQFEPQLTRQPTQNRRASVVSTNAPHVNGQTAAFTSPAASPVGAQASIKQPTAISQVSQQHRTTPLQDPHGEAIDPTTDTYIKVGNNAYKVDLTKDPQVQNNLTSRPTSTLMPKQEGTPVDPLAKQLEELRNAVSTSGSIRRKSIRRQSPPYDAQTSSRRNTLDITGGSSSLSPPHNNSNQQGAQPPQNSTPVRDYRNSAELVVGVHPSASRPSSPNPPTAAFMVPKPSITPSGSEIIDGVLNDYGQSLPGERKSVSRSNSPRNSFSSRPTSQSLGSVNNLNQAHHTPSPSQTLARPPSQVGHPGVGAHGSRSNSPQPPSRGPSPAPNGLYAPTQNVPRATSPNAVGIALDPSGRVLHDEMAQRYQQQQQQQQQQRQSQMQQQQPPPLQQPPPPPPLQPVQQHQAPPPQTQYTPAQSNVQRRTSYMSPVGNSVPPPPPMQGYGVPPAGSAPMYQPRTSYMQAPPAQPTYAAAPMYQPPPPQQPMYQQQQQPQQTGGYGGLQRGTSTTGAYYGVGGGQRHLQPQQAPVYQQHTGYRDPGMVGRSPSPQPPPPPAPQQLAAPTGQTTEDGAPILFYVKALYDYTATIDEEFDFQAGDIIAVTATPEDGWWSGELLDEERRQRGRHVFPSNFVCLF